MDRGSGQTLRDSTRSHHGVLGTTEAVEPTDPSWSSSGITGKALQFHGKAYASIPDHADLRITGDMTICASVYIDSFHQQDWVRVVGKADDLLRRNYGLWYHPNGTFLFQIYGEGASANASSTRPEGIIAGRWYTLVGVRKGTDVWLYMNGVRVASAKLPVPAMTGPGPVTIGKAPTVHTGHKGRIDQVVIYRRALSAREVRAKYRAAPVSKPRLSRAEVQAQSKARVAADTLALQQNLKEELALKPEIDAAIANGVERLLDTQLRDGSWGVYGHVGGQGGLCAYALLKCGVQMDHPALRRAFAYLDSVNPTATYAVACMLLAYGATGLPEHRPRMRRLLAILLRSQARQGTWAYPHGAPDLSNTQYAALGLWAADKAGLKVPTEVWTRLIEGTLKHQEEFHQVAVKITKHTGVGTREVAGFGYRPGKPKSRHGTGTMTTAGVSILKICEIGIGKKLGKNARRRLEHAVGAGLNWLETYFSVTQDQRPGQRGGTWLLYYLYGMERVGGLNRVEKFGDHWWYVEGARVLLKRQNKKLGGWGATHNTCFALLFLRRATKFGPMSGAAGGGRKRHLFAAGLKGDDIEFRGAGQQPLMLYINGFGETLLADHSKYGLRILRVEYFEGRRKLGHLASDPTKAWKSDTFLHRCPPLSQGTHTIEARVIAIDPDLPPGDTTKTVTIKSLPMQVRIRDVVEPWMEGIAKMQNDNLLKGLKFELKMSSNPKQAKLAADGMIHTSWLCGPKDAKPTLTFEFKKPIRARRLILTQPLQRREDLQRLGLIQQVELTWRKGKEVEIIEMNRNPLAATTYEFPTPRTLRKLTLRIVKRSGKAGLPVGFAEIVLAGKKLK